MEQSEPRYPCDDGWVWIYDFHQKCIHPYLPLRRLVRTYFITSSIETAGGGKIYRLLGVHLFGKMIPTGGILIRHLTKSRMKPYTLRGTSIGAARDFFCRACIFETLHFPFCVAMLVLSAQRYLEGEYEYAREHFLLNLLVNVYPMMHHRYTRLRIVFLLSKSLERR